VQQLPITVRFRAPSDNAFGPVHIDRWQVCERLHAIALAQGRLKVCFTVEWRHINQQDADQIDADYLESRFTPVTAGRGSIRLLR